MDVVESFGSSAVLGAKRVRQVKDALVGALSLKNESGANATRDFLYHRE
jgi:hypothetical protein